MEHVAFAYTLSSIQKFRNYLHRTQAIVMSVSSVVECAKETYSTEVPLLAKCSESVPHGIVSFAHSLGEPRSGVGALGE